MRSKYIRFFISSTFADMAKERESVATAFMHIYQKNMQGKVGKLKLLTYGGE